MTEECFIAGGCLSAHQLARKSMSIHPNLRSHYAPAPHGALLAGWAFTQDELNAGISGERLLNPSLDLSNPCNLNCPYCFIEEKNSTRKTRKPDELTKEETFEIIEDFASAGAATLNLVGAGEPTIDPIFTEVIRRACARKLKTVIFTNGSRLARDRGLAEFLLHHEATIVLKLNSFKPTIQDDLVGKKGYAVQRDRALSMLLDTGFANTSPTRLGINTIAARGNLGELPSIHEFARSHNIFPMIADFIPTGRTEGGFFVAEAALANVPRSRRTHIREALIPLEEQEREWLRDELHRIDKGKFHLTRRGGSSAYYGGQECSQILGVYVDILGRIWPCVARSRMEGRQLLSGLMGSVRRGDRPSEIWKNHPYLQAIRRKYDGGCPYKASLSAAARDSDGSHGKQTLVQIRA